jgi:hypothetical protein
MTASLYAVSAAISRCAAADAFAVNVVVAVMQLLLFFLLNLFVAANVAVFAAIFGGSVFSHCWCFVGRFHIVVILPFS